MRITTPATVLATGTALVRGGGNKGPSAGTRRSGGAQPKHSAAKSGGTGQRQRAGANAGNRGGGAGRTGGGARTAGGGAGARAGGGSCRFRVKMRNAHGEHSSSEMTPKANMAADVLTGPTSTTLADFERRGIPESVFQ